MWIFDKLFNRKIEGKSSLDDLAENVVVNKETNTTEISGNLDVSGNITKNGQPIVGGSKPKASITIKFASNPDTGITSLHSLYKHEDKLKNVKVGDSITIIVKHGDNITHILNFVCLINELPFNTMAQHFKCQGYGYTTNGNVNEYCFGNLDVASSSQEYPELYLSDTHSTIVSNNHHSTISVGDVIEIYF